MSLEKAPLQFSALNVAESFTPQQLEHITEFSDQVESLRFISRNLAGPEPTLAQAIEIVEAAPAVLRSKRKKKRKISQTDKAWHEELGSEFHRVADREGDRVPAVLSRGEMQGFLDVTRDDPRDHLIMRVFYASGMRISEVASVLVADLYLDELKILVRDGKGDKDRYVLIDPETARLLADFTRDLPPSERIFEIGDRQISRVVEKYAEELGIIERYEAIGRRFTPHSFRHTCATHLYEAGMDIYIIKDLLGHSSISVTREYIHIGINRHRSKYVDFHPLCHPIEQRED